MAEPVAEPVRVREVASPDLLPQAALALFGQDAFSTPTWYRTVIAAGLPDNAAPSFQVAEAAGQVLGVFPMLRLGRSLAALSTPYTCLWQPLLAPGLPNWQLEQTGRALADAWRRCGVVRLEAMPEPDEAWTCVLTGLRAGGLRLLAFDHFGNWHEAVSDWDSYLASRPRRLRTAIGRQTRRLAAQPGFAFSVVQDGPGLAAAIAAYETVYASSWKQPEPHPGFNPALMVASAADGSLRLGVLRLGDTPVAAQLWLVHGRWAGVLKLAYDEAHKAMAPGNVLTGLMIRHLLDGSIGEIDFGRGDDDYKQQWAAQRRQRVGLLVINPASLAGALAGLRHWGGGLRRKVKQGLLF